MSYEMPFGKHYGQPLDEVPTNYLRWVLRECTNIDQDLRGAIEEELRSRMTRRGRTSSAGKGAAGAGPPADWASVIARWYRQLALDFHPDRGGSTEQMQAINVAHMRLKELVGL